jgi:hypothetical protein
MTKPDPLRFWSQYGDDPCREYVVSWFEEESVYADTEAFVRRAGTSTWNTVTGSATTVHGTGEGEPWPLHLRHRVHLSGLAPAVDYEFKFTEFGNIYRVRTLPLSLTSPLMAMYSSDSIAVAQQCAALSPEFIAIFGDFGGSNGSPVFDYVRDYTRTFALVLRDGNRMIPMMVGVGNHDTLAGGGNTTHFHNLYYWPNHDLQANTGLWYELRAGDWLSLIQLDSEHNNSAPLTGSTPQELWYHARLAEGSEIRHRQVGWHVTPFPAYREYDEPQSQRVRRTLCPPAEQAGVRVGFVGHDHAYVRTFRMLHEGGIGDPDAVVVPDDHPLGIRWTHCAQGQRVVTPRFYAEATSIDINSTSVTNNYLHRVTFTPQAQTIEALDHNRQVFHTHVEPANPNAPKVGSSSGRRGRVGDSWGTVARQARQSGSWVGVT